MCSHHNVPLPLRNDGDDDESHNDDEDDSELSRPLYRQRGIYAAEDIHGSLASLFYS